MTKAVYGSVDEVKYPVTKSAYPRKAALKTSMRGSSAIAFHLFVQGVVSNMPLPIT